MTLYVPRDGVLRFTALEAWARGRFPKLGAVRERWSGMVLESIEGPGFIGKDPGGGDHVYVATGDSGMGMTHGTIAGMLIRDLGPKASLPITFYQGQFAARYEPSDQEPTALRDAVLFGFIPKTQANMLEYNYNDMAINLWSVIRGNMLPAEPGVFVDLNFSATKIDFYAPAPP